MRICFRGTVQGVGFRPAVCRTARALGLRGTVRNDGSRVTVEVDDGPAFLDAFLKDLPPLAHIDSVTTEESVLPPDTEGFSISDSSGGDGMGSPSIPADTAVCPQCVEDMRSGRRAGYPFTTCTSCGARFTLLRSLPYDRERTSMSLFPRCSACDSEYHDPSDRRFHHQTVCCPECGPSCRLVDGNGNPIPGDPIEGYARMLREGRIGISQGWGGMHINCTLAHVGKLREWYDRPQKPFAIMVRDEESVGRYAEMTPSERETLVSPRRPIVLLRKKDSPETELLSPGIDTVGVFLPYTGIQVLLFDVLEEDALVMTSANPPGEPMLISGDEALKMGADMYLLHDQPIINRADDSVVRLRGNDEFYLRKSRGSIPCHYDIRFEGSAVAVGAQENLAGAVCTGGRIYPTQYIGNGEKIGVPEYLDGALRLQMRLTGTVPEIVARDLHPAYASRRIASAIAEDYGAETVDVQHHWAHAASLMVDRNISGHLTVLALDGTGHGDDGQAWGGEVMSCTLDGYERLAHLEYMPLIGGQKAVTDIRRLRLAADLANGVRSDTGFSDPEVAILSKLASSSVRTSSFGRFLDTVSYSAGVCSVRTYDGEPAMKLERFIDPDLETSLSTYAENGVIRTAHLFRELDGVSDPRTYATSAVRAVLDEMVDIACDDASSNGDGYIGITGGVSYDVPVTEIARRRAEKRGMRLLVHSRVPNGDGGISTGQAAIALNRL